MWHGPTCVLLVAGLSALPDLPPSGARRLPRAEPLRRLTHQVLLSLSTSDHSELPSPRVCVELGLRDKQARMGVPYVEVLIKHKYREDVDDAPLKVREILPHSGHPFRLANKKLSRCLSLVWKFAESLPSTTEVVSMERLKSFVHGVRGSSKTGGLWGGLDIVQMFPNIAHPMVVEALLGSDMRKSAVVRVTLCFSMSIREASGHLISLVPPRVILLSITL